MRDIAKRLNETVGELLWQMDRKEEDDSRRDKERVSKIDHATIGRILIGSGSGGRSLDDSIDRTLLYYTNIKKQLTEKDAEIERLKGENEEHKKAYIILVDLEGRHLEIKAHNLIEARKLNDAFHKEIRQLNTTITSREAEANSYRELYNELRNIIMSGQSAKNLKPLTPKSVLHELQCIKNEVVTYREASLSNANDYQYAVNKYRRLVTCLIQHSNKGLHTARGILETHRANEKKLTKKRGKKNER